MDYLETLNFLGVPEVLGESTTDVLVDRDGQNVGQLVQHGGYVALHGVETPSRRPRNLTSLTEMDS